MMMYPRDVDRRVYMRENEACTDPHANWEDGKRERGYDPVVARPNLIEVLYKKEKEKKQDRGG